MKQKLCVLYIGQTRTLFDLTIEHTRFLEHYKQNYDVDTFCVVSDTERVVNDTDMSSNMNCKITNILHPKKILSTIQFESEFTDILTGLTNHRDYTQNLQYVASLENDVVGKQELSCIMESQIRQFFYLRKGIDMIEEYELENKFKYDVFIKTRFDFVLNAFYDTSVLFDENIAFKDLLCGKNNIYASQFDDAKKQCNINSDFEYFKYIENLHIDHYASRIYTDNPMLLNMGGRYIKNYDTIMEIFKHNKCSQQIDNLIYFVNDWFFFTRRSNMSKLKYFVMSYGQNKLNDLFGNHIFAPEYQLFAYCKNNDLLPIVHISPCLGGLFRKQIALFDGNIIPANKQFSICGYDGRTNDKSMVFDEITDKILTIKHLEYYCYFGEELEITFDCVCQNDINMTLVIDHQSAVFPKNIKSFVVKNGKFSYKTKCNFYGKFFIRMDFRFNGRIQLTIPKVKHQEINLTYMSFFTCGQPYDNAYNLLSCDTALSNLTNKYADNYISIKMHELDTPDDRQYITLNCPAKKQIGTIININVEKIAYFKWKAHIILKYLRTLPDNHILMYRDGNIEKYTSYKNSFNTLKRNVTLIMSTLSESFFMAYENSNMKSVFHQKNYLSEYVKINQNEFYNNHNLISAATFVCRKTPEAIAFLENWARLCLNEDLINFEHISSNENFQFRWHCNDQAIMNALIIKMKQDKKLNINFPYYIYDKDRVFDCSNFIDIRSQKQYNGFILNRMQLVTDQIQYSCGSIVYRIENDVLHFIRSGVSGTVGNQWIGYQIFRNRVNTLKFQIKFINFVPKLHQNVGLKIHLPVSVSNDWLENCKVDQWCDVQFQITQISSEYLSDLAILIFDDAEPNTEFELKNFIVC